MTSNSSPQDYEIPSENNKSEILETAIEYRQRWVSIRIIYFSVFLMTLGFSFVLTGVWPYLNKLDKSMGKEFMGWVVASNPLSQMLLGPLVGWWANKLGSVRQPLITGIIIFIFSNVLYSVLELLVYFKAYWMLASRFLVGCGTASLVVCRSYVSAATTLEERTTAVSMMSLAQILGFIVGPAIQACVTPLGDEGYVYWNGWLPLNMFTACGWISAFLGVINLVLLFPVFFKERPIAAKEAMLITGAVSEKAAWKEMKLDYLSAWTLIWAFFIFSFNFVLLETISTSLTMDQFAWSNEEALYYMGILLSAAGVIGCATFAALGPLSRKVGEINLLIWGAFLFMVVGGICYIPWGTPPPQIAYPEGDGVNGTNSTLGCPVTQDWCLYTPAMTIKQFFVGSAFYIFGYPIGLSLIQTIFSKVLGPRPQGVWMGMLTFSGCLSRVMGPVFVSIIYTRLGTIWTFGLTAALMIIAMIWLQLFVKRLKESCQRGTMYNQNKKGDRQIDGLELQEILQPL